MKIIYLVLSIMLITSCSTAPPKTFSWDDGSILTIDQTGCILNLTFKNNSNKDVYLGGNLIETHKNTGEVLGSNYVFWKSNLVPVGGFVRGEYQIGASMLPTEVTLTGQHGFGCVNTKIDSKITVTYQ